METFIKWAGACVGVALAVYILARCVFAAYFFTKQQHEKRMRNHG